MNISAGAGVQLSAAGVTGRFTEGDYRFFKDGNQPQEQHYIQEDNPYSALSMLAEAYEPIHPPLVIIICICGALCNVIMILVLSRKEIFSPTNLMLLSLSLSQLFLLLNYLYITLYKLFADIKCYQSLWNVNWVYCLLLNVNLSVVFHTAGVFHVVAISFVRFVTLTFFSRRQSPWFTLTAAKLTAATIYVLVFILSIPFYLNSEVVREDEAKEHCRIDLAAERNKSNGTLNIYTIRYSRFATSTNLLIINFWLFGIMCKLIPCITVLILTVGLARMLNKFERHAATVRSGRPTTVTIGSGRSGGGGGPDTNSKKPEHHHQQHHQHRNILNGIGGSQLSLKLRRKIKATHSCPPASASSTAAVNQHHHHSNNKNYSRTSYMILIVMVLFVLVELPQGVLNLFMGIFGQGSFQEWHSVADIFEMLTVLYSSVNFVIYCSMSSQFRDAFSAMFHQFFATTTPVFSNSLPCSRCCRCSDGGRSDKSCSSNGQIRGDGVVEEGGCELLLNSFSERHHGRNKYSRSTQSMEKKKPLLKRLRPTGTKTLNHPNNLTIEEERQISSSSKGHSATVPEHVTRHNTGNNSNTRRPSIDGRRSADPAAAVDGFLIRRSSAASIVSVVFNNNNDATDFNNTDATTLINNQQQSETALQTPPTMI